MWKISCLLLVLIVSQIRGDSPNKPHPKCGKDSIKCETSNKCYREHQRCDGHVNCPIDGSDEDDCDECNGEHVYHCVAEKKCLPGNETMYRCDGYLDCADDDTTSDEQGCDAYCDANDKTKCTAEGTRCIPNNWWCDKYFEGPDCADGEDENNCSECIGEHVYHCVAEKKCLPGNETMYRCDGYLDCADDDTTSDEQGCDAYCDANDKTKCTAEGTRCIPNNWWCDKYFEGPDCADGEDENNCSGYVCPEGRLKCESDNTVCIWGYKCNGVQDCADGSDEEECTKDDCELNEAFYCPHEDDEFCVRSNWVCDANSDCKDGEEDWGCGYCPDDKFACANEECVDPDKVCDDNDDCGDHSDEHGCHDDDDDDDDDDDKRHLAREGKKDKTIGGQKSNMASRTLSNMASRTRKEILKRNKVHEYKHVMLAKSKRRNQIDRMARGRKHDTVTDDRMARGRKHDTVTNDRMARGRKHDTVTNDRLARGRKHDAVTNVARERTRTSLKKSKSANVRGYRQPTTNTRANGNVRQTQYHGNGKMYSAQTVDKMRKEKRRNEVETLLKSLKARLNANYKRSRFD